MVLGKVFGGAAIAMLQGLLFLVLGWLTIDDIDPSIPGFVAAVVLMTVISIALTALGFILAWRMDSTQGFHAVMSVFLFPMWLLSGAFFPMTVDGWMKPIVWANPLTYGVAGLRHALQNMSVETAATLPSPALSWLVSLVFAGAMLAGAHWIAKTRSTGDLL
jgi:ABC-2 type transport system permease protein